MSWVVQLSARKSFAGKSDWPRDLFTGLQLGENSTNPIKGRICGQDERLPEVWVSQRHRVEEIVLQSLESNTTLRRPVSGCEFHKAAFLFRLPPSVGFFSIILFREELEEGPGFNRSVFNEVLIVKDHAQEGPDLLL